MREKKIERSYFYLKGDEQLGEIIDLLRKAKDKEIVLIVPPGALPAFSHPIHIEVLAKEIKNLKKEVFISTDDLKIIDLCRHHGIPLFLEAYKNFPLSEELVSDLKVTEEEKKSEKKPKRKIKIKLAKLKLIFPILILISVGLIFFTNFQTKVKIFLSLNKFSKEVAEVVQIDSLINKPDFDKLILPGKLIELETSHSTSIETSGKTQINEGTARGLIEIQNFNNVPLPLRTGTRFVFADKVYRIKTGVTVPPKNGDEAGKLVVEVVADKQGKEMNLEAGVNFIIPGLQETIWGPLVKAVAVTPIEAKSGLVGVVAPNDIDNLRLNLEKEIKNKLVQELRKSYPDSVFDVEGAVFTPTILNISHKPGEITDRVSATANAKLQTVVISNKDILELMKYLASKEHPKYQIENIEIMLLEILDLNFAKNNAVVRIKSKINLKPEINLESLKASFAGKSVNEVQLILKEDKRIINASIEIFPAWKNRFPKDSEKIQIILR